MHACMAAGIQVKLFSTRLQAVMKPEALQQLLLEAQNEPLPIPAKGKGKGRPGSTEKGNKDRPRSGQGKKDKEAQEAPAGEDTYSSGCALDHHSLANNNSQHACWCVSRPICRHYPFQSHDSQCSVQ